MSADNSILIRDVVAEDAEHGAAIINEWWDETVWITREEDETHEHIREDFRKNWPRPRVFVAERDGEMLGYLALSRKDPNVGGIFVRASDRRSGVGTKLINHAKALNPDGLTLWVAEANEFARSFYRQHGFETLHYISPENDDHPGGGDFLLKWPGKLAAPVLETERLILRRPRAEDQEAVTAFFRSERSEHAGGHVPALRAWLLFAAELGHWEIRGWGCFAITQKGSDECIGLAGPWFPETWSDKEIGWMVFDGWEGRGVAFEAATAARNFVFDTLKWDTAVSYIDPANTRSIRLAERLGAVRDDVAGRPDPGDLVYRHPHPGGLAG